MLGWWISEYDNYFNTQYTIHTQMFVQTVIIVYQADILYEIKFI